MSDVMLFNQYFTINKDSTEKIFPGLPINLLNLATYLNDNEVKCKIAELGIFSPNDSIIVDDRIRCGTTDESIIDIIEREKPKVIGLSCMYSRHYVDIITITKLIKDAYPGIFVVTGGNHATTYPEMVLNSSEIDFVVLGEGEITFHELCTALINGEDDYDGIAGLSYRDNEGKITTTKARPLIKNLDILPIPDYTLLDVGRYLNMSYLSPFAMRYPHTGIMTSRGCPFKCNFCTVKAVWGRTFRGKSAKLVVDEIETLINRYGVREVGFLDDSASTNKKRWMEICDEIINRNIDIRWSTPNGIAFWTLDKPALKRMKEAGCYRITFGIESGNLETRKYIKKTYDLNQAKELTQYANKIGLWTASTNILGFTYETADQMQDTIKYAKTSGVDFAAFFLLNPMPTSEVYDDFKKEGLADFDSIFSGVDFNAERYDEMYKMLNEEGAPNKNFSRQEMKKIHLNAYRSFLSYRAATFLNPARVIQKINSLEDLKYLVKLGKTGLRILSRSLHAKTTKTLLYNSND
jgi:magnesium-protoporphyrin IX monomethyl ester (oxidative) cyclase